MSGKKRDRETGRQSDRKREKDNDSTWVNFCLLKLINFAKSKRAWDETCDGGLVFFKIFLIYVNYYKTFV